MKKFITFTITLLLLSNQSIGATDSKMKQEFDQRRMEAAAQRQIHRQQVLQRIQERFSEIQDEFQGRQSTKTQTTTPSACQTQNLTLDQVNFAFNSDKLNNLATSTLDEVAKILNENPEQNIDVAGHTDVRGTEIYNDNLSMRRACSVVNYLEDKGVSTARLLPQARGESQPVKLGLSENDHAINRRVEIAPSAK